MLMAWPLATIVHVSRCSALVNSFGTVTVNMPHWRPGRKCVGCPWSGPPGSMRLSGPMGTSICRVLLRLR